MKYLLLIAIILSSTACGRHHGYEVGTCFKGDDAGNFWYQITDIRDNNYMIRDVYKIPKEAPPELSILAQLATLPNFRSIDSVDLSSRWVQITCPN